MTDDPRSSAQRAAAFGTALSATNDLAECLVEPCGARQTVAAFVGVAVAVARAGGISRDDFAALMAGAMADGYRGAEPDA